MTSTRTERALTGLDKLYEFEREPVSADKLQPGRHFAGLFAGEHVAATEFVIGVMFVNWGVRAFDIFVGLLIGNLLAVLSWTLICAPVAVQTRLTLYWYLRRIAGPLTTTLYNVLNAVLFCILAGCMITVAASAVRIPFGIGAQVHWYPEDLRFVAVVLLVGAVVVTLAILGFTKLAQFATVCSPWLLLMFLAGAVAALPSLAATAGLEAVRGFDDFWVIARDTIWTGNVPDGSGQTPISFWQVAAFAWICNLAMHAGLSDMALFRYAKRTSYGLYSALGMFLGHYLAWIAAGVMGAAAAIALDTNLSALDSGGVARQVLGVCGIIAVVIAGWTTANPTLYRAGLAFQAVTPDWPRWLVTLAAGAATTIIACFPFVFTSLLAFIGYYGLLLMPVGAIIITEHWIFPRIGLTRYWVSRRNLTASWPAMLSWAIAIALAVTLERTGTLHLFYLFVPIWLLTMVLYIVFSRLAGAVMTESADESLPARSASEGLTSPHEGPHPASKTQCNDEGVNSTSSLAGAAGWHDESSPADAGANSSSSPAGLEVPRDRRVGQQPTGSDLVYWIVRPVAVASLLTCLALSIWVFRSPPDQYERNFSLFKTVLIWPTLVYFVSGTVWMVLRTRRKAGS